MRQRSTFALLPLLALVLLLGACSQSVSGSNYTTGEVLQKSAQAMQNLKSSHVDLRSTSNIQASNVPGSGTDATPTPTTNGSLTIVGSGDQALPSEQQMNFTINNSIKVAQIYQSGKVYVQNAQGQWYVMDQSVLENYVGNPLAGVQFDQKALLGLIQHSKITDKGLENLNGQSLRHINAELDKTAIKQLFSENPQLKSSLGSQDVDTVLNSTKSFLSTVDVWIDETNFYLHRLQLKLKLNADTTAATNNPSDAKVDLDTAVDLSKFNDPVTITPPTNATPTSNPIDIFSGTKPSQS